MIFNPEYRSQLAQTGIKVHDISCERYREYEFLGLMTPYRIDRPQYLLYREGGETHRIVDSDGVVHCVPKPGSMGCILRWKNWDTSRPVRF